MAPNDLSELYKGLQIAKGDRLVDVLQIWDYRVRKDFDRGDCDRILRYSVDLLPEIVAIMEKDETDVELRATVAETLVSFILILDKIIDSADVPAATIEKIRNRAVTGLVTCLSRPVSIRAKSAISRAAIKFRETAEVKSLRAAILNDQSLKDLIGELDSLNTGKKAAEGLVEYGPAAVGPLRRFLLEGVPRKIFHPRLWAVEALARLGAKDVLVEYLSLEKDVPDPEDRFGEEAVESAAARFLSAWPEETVYRFLLKLSERKMLVGLIEALARFNRPESIPCFERALEDDFYRPPAEEAFVKMGAMACDALAESAVTPHPSLVMETPSSLQRRRCALRLLGRIGMVAQYWPTLRVLLDDPDAELFITASKLGVEMGSKDDRATIAPRILRLLSSVPWHLQEEVEQVLVLLGNDAAAHVDEEIARRMRQPEEIRAGDFVLRLLIKVRRQQV